MPRKDDRPQELPVRIIRYIVQHLVNDRDWETWQNCVKNGQLTDISCSVTRISDFSVIIGNVDEHTAIQQFKYFRGKVEEPGWRAKFYLRMKSWLGLALEHQYPDLGKAIFEAVRYTKYSLTEYIVEAAQLKYFDLLRDLINRERPLSLHNNRRRSFVQALGQCLDALCTLDEEQYDQYDLVDLILSIFQNMTDDNNVVFWSQRAREYAESKKHTDVIDRFESFKRRLDESVDLGEGRAKKLKC